MHRAMCYDVVYCTRYNHVLRPPKYHKVDVIQKTVKVSRSNHKEWLEICTIFFEDGVDKMMRNASCFILLFLVRKFEHYRFATLQILLSLTRRWFRIQNSTVHDNITLEKCAKLCFINWDLAELKVSWDDSVAVLRNKLPQWYKNTICH